jgi:hypothetical protein
MMQNPGENTHKPAVARLTANPSGNVVLLCERDLNWWLDEADEQGDAGEPLALAFLGEGTR